MVGPKGVNIVAALPDSRTNLAIIHIYWLDRLSQDSWAHSRRPLPLHLSFSLRGHIPENPATLRYG